VDTGNVFSNLAGILGLAAGGGVLARLMKQPPLVGYILAGICLSGLGWGMENPQMRVVIEVMGRFGVTLLLFLAGLELPLSELKRMGKVSLVTGMGQVVISAALGYFLAGILGFSGASAIYLSIAVSFASTILAVKLLSEKGDMQSLPGKIAVGHLLIQDFVIIGIMVVLTGFNSGEFIVWNLLAVLIKGLLMVAVAVWLSETVMGRISDYLARSTEILFIASIGWCLVVAAAVASPVLGFSVEMGGFLAGLTLAKVAEQAQIISRVRPLRDFFLTWFFVALGANVRLAGLSGVIIPALILSVFVMIFNPLVMMLILGLFGYRKRTYFIAGLTIAQISEFSLVIVANAVSTGQIPQQILVLVTLVGILTMTCSTYLLWNSHKLYLLLGGFIRVFERRKPAEAAEAAHKMKDHVILFGHNRVGSKIRPALEKTGREVMVVDFNPVVVEKLKAMGIQVLYGDMADQELYSKLNLGRAYLVVSTVPDINDSLQLLSGLSQNRKANRIVVMTADNDEDARSLYDKGADYVLLPHSVGGEFLAHLIEREGAEELIKRAKGGL
jgi:Kef-type K+ transport system membrane component KefB